MEPFLARLLEGCFVIWLMDRVLALLKLNPPADYAIKIVTLVLAILWILFGGFIVLGLPHLSR